MNLPTGFAEASSSALPLHVLDPDQFAAWREGLAPALQSWVDAQQFVAAAGALVLLPGEQGIAGAALGIGDPQDPYSYAHAPHGLPPAEVLHVGDHIEMDVLGAARAGLRSCWINREGHAWTHATLRPDLEFADLTALADWLDAQFQDAKEHAAA